MGFRVSGRYSGPSFPNALNTGPSVPLSSLTNVPAAQTSGSGWTWNSGAQSVQVSGTDGVTLDSLNITASASTTGAIKVEAQGVTISNCVITTTDPTAWGVVIGPNGSTPIDGLTITDCLFTGANPGSQRMKTAVIDTYGIATNLLVQRCNITWSGGGLQATRGTFRDNYMHDLGSISTDHLEGIHCDGPGNPAYALLVEHNTILIGLNDAGYPQTSAITVNQSFGVPTNVFLANNLVAGGGYVMACGASSNGPRNDLGCAATNGANGGSVTGGSSSQALVQDSSAMGYDVGATITCAGHIPSGTFVTGTYNIGGVLQNGNFGGTQMTLSCLPSAITTGTGLTFNVNPVTSDIIVANNRVSTMYFPDGGGFGPVETFDNGAIGNAWYGNVWHDGPLGGQAIAHP